MLTNEGSYSSNENAICLQSVCESDEVAVGCTASDRVSKNITFSGVERINVK